MACTCISELTAQVKERYGPDAYLETVFTINMSSGESFGEKPKPLALRYPKTKADGTPSERYAKANIYFSFCPFCGKPYDEPEQATS